METKQPQPVRLAFIWDFSVTPIELHSWGDGLNAALKTLSSEDFNYLVKVIANDKAEVIYEEIKNFDPDVILAWGSLDRPSFAGLRQFKKPTALCFAGGPTEHSNTDNFDVIFVENVEYQQKFAEQGIHVELAFGTNEYLFRTFTVNKNWLACYPCAFAGWKRLDLFSEAVGKDGIVVGKILPEELHIVKNVVQNGCTIMAAIPYQVMPYIYNQSKFALITAHNVGGSQRAVLEAMACGTPPIVMSDNIKNREFVEDANYGFVVDPDVDKIKTLLKELSSKPMPDPTMGRRFIENRYTSKHYAQKIDKCLKEIL